MSSRINHNNITQLPGRHHTSSFSIMPEPLPYVKQKNHISVANNLVCDIFHCNGEEGVDQWERQPSSNHSVLDDSINSRQIVSFKKYEKTHLDKSREKSSSFFNESFALFSKRKNIFDTSTLHNTTIDVCSYERP